MVTYPASHGQSDANVRNDKRTTAGRCEYSMQQPETTLIYWAPSRVRFNLTLILAAAVILFGLYQLFTDARRGDDPPAEPAAQTQDAGGESETPAPARSGGSGAWLLIVVGLGVGAYSWLTSPRQYRVYSDALIIMFGTPRRRTIHFSDIREVASDRGFMGDPLRVYTNNRKRVPIQVREPEEMHRYLDSALADFRRAYPQYAPPEEPESGEDTPDVVESTTADMTDATAAAGPEPATNGTAEAQPAPPAEPDDAPERSPRSRRRSLRDDAPSDEDGGENRPRIS